MSTADRSPNSSRICSNWRVGAGKSSAFRVARRVLLSASSASRCSPVSSRHADAHVFAGEHLRAERLGPAAGQVAELAGHEADDRVGHVVLVGVRLEVGGVGLHRREVQREVADDLRRRRDLRHAAEDLVGRRVHVLDELEVVGEAECDRLLAEVGELAAGDLVVVHAAGRPGQARTRTACTGGGPPPSRARGRRPPAARCRCRARCARARRRATTRRAGSSCPPSGALATSTASTPARLAARSVASCPPAVSWVCRCTGTSKRSRSAATRRSAAAGRRSPAMSLIARMCAPAPTISLGEAEVVVERVEVFGRIEQVARVAERHLGHGVTRSRAPSRSRDASARRRSVRRRCGRCRRRSLPPRARTRRSPRSGTACSRPCCVRGAASGC